MRQAVRTFLDRPIAEDFSFTNQRWQSLQGGCYVFLFLYFFGHPSFTKGAGLGPSGVALLAIFGAGCVGSTLVANWLVPTLLPRIYKEDNWTVWKHVCQTLFVLFCVSVGNQLLLRLLHLPGPTFGRMYMSVTIIGFFPVTMSVFITEQRRLKRNLAHAQALNEQLARNDSSIQANTSVTQPPARKSPAAAVDKPIVLSSDSGKERLTLHADQLLYIESVGNYVEVHWLNQAVPQKTVLRNTLKDVAEVLAEYPQFFRSHRAYLINVKAVSRTAGNTRGYQLTLREVSVKIPVSRSYVDAFDARISVLR